MSCNYTRETSRGVHECVQNNCDGTNHYTEFYPYVKPHVLDTIVALTCTGAIGLTLGVLLSYYFRII